MKRLIILFLSVCLITACNNDGKNPFARKDKTDKASEKEKEEGDKKDERKQKDDDDKTAPGDSRGNWTKSDEDKWMNKCGEVMNDNSQAAKKVCACMLDKAEHKYRDFNDAENGTEEEGKMIMQECIAGTKDKDDDAADEYVNRNKTGDDNKDDNTNTGSWTKLQRDQYIKGCETTARRNQQGYTAQQIFTYCECMTRKVERKYSFQQAASMTAADFQTREWQNAATDCLPHY